VRRYLFVSSISVFTDASRPGVDETAPVGVLENPATEAIGKHYGPLKAACEAVVTQVYGARALNVRPGLIVGPYDPTDRFGYWVARFVHPLLLGDRAAAAIVPLPAARPLQFIDARDLAAFMLDLLAADASGTFLATSPAGHWTFDTLAQALVAAAGTEAPRPRLPVRRDSWKSIARRRSVPGCAPGRWRPRSRTPPRGSRSATMPARGRTCSARRPSVRSSRTRPRPRELDRAVTR
jgi:nucleoside-diphosphate-sugar epimerase